MRTQLLRHNISAYKKVMDALSTSNRTCVVHPTGTGKSFLIAAVSESFRNVLVLAPNIFVLSQLRKVLSWRKNEVEFMTYQALMYADSVRENYDLICLDEFHRAGAPEWGDAVCNLLEKNAGAKVFGATATPVRDCDGNRDMVTELFNGNVASTMSVAEAWNRNIIPIPTYVTGLFDFSSTLRKATEVIRNSKYISKEEKRIRMTRLNNIRLDWERSEGMPDIIKKYLDANAHRVIVFCASIDMLERMQQTVCGWFRKAGMEIRCVSMMHTQMSNGQLRMAMEDFEKDDANGLRLMFSVNMLNEGIHIPRVNAVLMLRTTASRIIFLQQLGRCLTAANTDKPVVFDMVDNMTQTNIIHSIREEYNSLERKNPAQGQEPRIFTVHDHRLSYKEMIAGLTSGATNNRNTDEQAIGRVLQFIERNNRLPAYNADEDERRLYWLMMERRSVMENIPRIAALLKLNKKHGKDGADDNLSLIRDFITEKGRLPRRDEKPYFGKWRMLRTTQGERPEVLAIIRDYTARHMTDFEATEWARRAIAFINANGRLPNNFHGKEEKELNFKIKILETNYTTRPMVREMIELKSLYRIESDDKIAEDIIRFERENGRMPASKTEHSLYSKFLRRRKSLSEKNPAIKALCDKYYTDTESLKQQRTEKLREYCEKYGVLPSKRNAPEIYLFIPYLRSNPTDGFLRLMEEYTPTHVLSKKEIARRIKAVESFAEEHQRLPSTARAGERQVSSWWEGLKKERGTLPAVRELLERYPRLRDKKNNL